MRKEMIIYIDFGVFFPILTAITGFWPTDELGFKIGGSMSMAFHSLKLDL